MKLAVKLALGLMIATALVFSVFAWQLRSAQLKAAEQLTNTSADRICDIIRGGARFQMLRNDREALASGLMSFTEYYRINSGDFEKETETLAQNYRHLFDLERKFGLPEGLLASGLRKGLTFTPEQATVVDPEDIQSTPSSEPSDPADADTL